MDNLLIATWGRVFVRWADGDIEPVLETGGPFYGLTWDEEHVYVGARCWGIDIVDHLMVLDRDLKQVDEYELVSRAAVHQILYHEGWVYITDTKIDRVIRWRPGEWEVVFDLGTGEDVYHINSLWHDGEHFWAAGLHGHVWRDWELWDQVNFEVHNVYREDDQMILGASDRQAVSVGGRLVSLEGPVGVMHDAGDLWQAYTRGLARGPDCFYVGAAAVENERAERWQGNSAVIVFDEAWQSREVLRFEETGGMHEIRVMGVDRAHNGVDW